MQNQSAGQVMGAVNQWFSQNGCEIVLAFRFFVVETENAMDLKAPFFACFVFTCCSGFALDTDSDGLDDSVETGTGIFISLANTGTKFDLRDSDADGVADGVEIHEKTNPNSPSSLNTFSQNLVGFYAFNGSGFDLSANSNSATALLATFSSDRFDEPVSALTFNGVDQFVDTTDSAAYRNLGSQLTISFWCRPDGPSKPTYLISKDIWGGSQWAVLHGYHGAEVLDFAKSGGFVSAAVQGPTGRWTQCVIVVDGTQCRCYGNGVQTGSTAIPSGLAQVIGAKVRFGGARTASGAPISQFKGALDDIRIYNRPLSGSEIQSLYRFEANDSDGDGIRNLYETATGIYVSPQDTGTRPDDDDSDDDGILDGIEILVHASNPNVKDSDGDGFDDLFEVETGFNPADATNTPETFSSIQTAVEFRFNAGAGMNYRVEGSSDLNTWATVEPLIIGTGNTVARFYSITGVPHRFFRARRN